MNLGKKTLALVVLTAAAFSASAQLWNKGNEITGATSAASGTSNETPRLEKCSKKLGTLAVNEPQDALMKLLSSYSLPSPTQMIRLIIQQSGCFAVVERGIAMQNVMQERALAEGGQMRSNQNIGRGQMVTADYVMTADILFKNSNAGAIGGFLGGMIGGNIGSMVGGSLKMKSAQVTMTMADVRSSLQVGASTGSSESADIGIGGVIGIPGTGSSAGLGAYENTAEGKVVAAAALDAYNQLVRSIRGSNELSRGNASLNVATAGRDAQANAANSGDVGRAKIGNISVYQSPDSKALAFKLSKGEEMVILGQQGNQLEIQTDKGTGWVDARMIQR